MTRSFTLLEVLVVALLLGLAATLVSANLRGSGDRAVLNRGARVIESVFSELRSQAQLRRRPATVLFGAEGERIGVERTRAGESKVTWRSLGGARLAALRGAAPNESKRLRVGPAGVWLPWTMTLQRGSASLELVSDGLSVALQPEPQR